MITPYSNIISVTTLAPNLLLDTYSGAAAAYSLRGLNTEYVNGLNPYAVTVRNGAGDHANIGFVFNSLTGDYDLDVDALLAHCVGSNGFVTDWYDQSGNGYDATQTTAASQPQIVSSGSVILENGKPALSFDGGNDWFEFNSFNSNAGDLQISIFATLKSDFSKLSQQSQLITTNNSTYGNILRTGVGTDGVFITVASGDQISGTMTSNQSVVGIFVTNSSTYNSVNGLTDGNYVNRNLVLEANAFWSIGQEYDPGGINGDFFDGKIQEIEIYLSDQSSNRTGIESNINNFYSIY